MIVKFLYVILLKARMAVVHVLYHHRGGWIAVEIALSSMYSITKLAIVALTGDPMAQPNVCW